MERKNRIDRDRHAKVLWRVAFLVAFAALVFGLEHLAQAWLLPSQAAAQALEQMRPSDAAAESLRLFEFGRQLLPVLGWALVVTVGLVLFVPTPRHWVRRIRDSLP